MALTLGASGSAQPLPSSGVAVGLSFGPRPLLAVASAGASSGFGLLASAFGSSSAVGTPPAQVVVDLPSGYTASPPAPGTPVGIAILASTSIVGQTGSTTLVTAALTADDPSRYASDPAAQACAPGTPIAVWKLTSTVVGLGYTLPIFVGHPAEDPNGVELRFCPPPLTGPDGKPLGTPPVPLAGAVFLLTPLREPTAAGSYTSRALITALGSNGTPDPQTTAEVRFLRVVPHVLTATGRYDPKTKDAVITGRVTELGKPEPRATVEYEAASTNGLVVVLNSGSSKKVRTSAAGTFTIHKRISKTTVFVLDVPSTTGACRGTSAAPRGCLSETTEGTGEKDVRVVVPRR